MVLKKSKIKIPYIRLNFRIVRQSDARWCERTAVNHRLLLDLWQFAFTGEKTEKYLLLYTYSTVIFRLFIKKTAEFFQSVFFNAGNVGATDGKLPGNCFLSFLRSSEQTVPETDDLVFPGR